MAAYAALRSLSYTVDQILIHNQYPFLLKKRDLISLHHNVCTIMKFLENNSHKSNETLENRIINAAYQAEDIIDYEMSSSSKSCIAYMIELCISACWPKQMINYMSFRNVLEEIVFILEETKNINDGSEENISLPEFLESATITCSDAEKTIVFEDDFIVVKNRVLNKNYSDFHVIPIVGMGGIGKSTLARRVYEDSVKAQHFDRCIWIVVSQNHSVRKILLGILPSLIAEDRNERQSLEKYSDSELKRLVYQELFGRRYLFVVDDLWSKKAWDDLSLIFPKENKGSRVMVTTRMSDVATHVGSYNSPPHDVNFLSEDQSWRPLEQKVFGKGSCPSQLRQIGMEIVRKCQGLPLLIVVVAGLLTKNVTEEYWGSFSRKVSSEEPTIALHCSKVLSLSYDCLSLYLKPCFLYVTAFPEDYNIKVDRLIWLWMAEGFVEPNESKCLEEVAMEYLDDLVSRNLILVSKRRYDGRIKTVKVHDVLREVGTLIAQKERFYFCNNLESMGYYKQRRLSIHNGFESYDFVHNQDPMTRSLLVFPSDGHTRGAPFVNFRLLKVLDALNEPLKINVDEMVLLRYLAIRNEKELCHPKSMSKLKSLQTLFIYERDPLDIFGFRRLLDPSSVFRLHFKVWKMPSLRHLITRSPCVLEQPSQYESVEETNLQTLSLVANLELSSQTVKMFTNVRKMGLYYHGAYQLGRKDYQLGNLILLEKLEELEMVFYKVDWSADLELAFPPMLKKLIFSCRDPSNNMNIALDLLPNVEVLKLRGEIFKSRKWDPVEDQFLNLRYLELDSVNLKNWGVDSVHFPSLEILVLKNMGDKLKEIPSSIGEIDSLKLIQLHYCEPSIIASAKKIQSDQWEMATYDLQVLIAEEDISWISGDHTITEEEFVDELIKWLNSDY